MKHGIDKATQEFTRTLATYRERYLFSLDFYLFFLPICNKLLKCGGIIKRFGDVVSFKWEKMIRKINAFYIFSTIYSIKLTIFENL